MRSQCILEEKSSRRLRVLASLVGIVLQLVRRVLLPVEFHLHPWGGLSSSWQPLISNSAHPDLGMISTKLGLCLMHKDVAKQACESQPIHVSWVVSLIVPPPKTHPSPKPPVTVTETLLGKQVSVDVMKVGIST